LEEDGGIWEEDEGGMLEKFWFDDGWADCIMPFCGF
jgi:hypothetical protein